LGLIKVQTCYYGGIAVIRDDEKLFEKMYKLQEKYQLFTKKMFVKRIMMGCALMTITNHRRAMTIAVKGVAMISNDREDFLVGLLR
jgi:ribulose 1,5-bisphosphate carboxylase large subunit-like protein